MTDAPAIRFFHVWDTYAKVVAANYMFHREIGEAIQAALDARFDGRPVSVIDLGCGDAATFAPLLEGRPLKSYRGADLSEAALALAKENLSRLGCPVELDHTDMMSELEEAPPADVINVSFALHHLTTEQKAEFLRLASKKLAPGGVLLLTDVMREEGQSLADYLSTYTGWLRGTMVTLSGSEKDAICDHILNNDLPETASVLRAQATDAGLLPLAMTSPQKWHCLLPFVHA